MNRTDHADLTRRIRVGPLLVGMLGLLLLGLTVVSVNAESTLVPSTPVALVSCMLSAGLAGSVLSIRYWVLREAHLRGPATGYITSTVLLVWSGLLLPGFTASAGPFDTSTAIELVLLALTAPAVLVITQQTCGRAWCLRLAAVSLVGLGGVLSVTDVVSSDPADLPLFIGACLLVMLTSIVGAVVWLRGRGPAPGDAEGWVGVGLVLTAGVVVLAMVEMAAGRGGSFALIGLMIAWALLSTGLLSSFASTLQHRRDLDEQFTSRIVASLLEGFETTTVEDVHIREVEAVLAGRMLTTVLQPVVRLSDGRVEDYESLARFATATPDQAFSAAAAIGREVELELLAAGAALLRLPDLPEGVGLAINIGPEALLHPAFTTAIVDCGQADRIVVELTEHRLMPHLDAVRATLDGLRSHGVKVAVDDVGAGFTGLRVLANLRPDFVKLDRSLISQLVDDPLTQALVAGVQIYADRTGAMIIAEGVEDAITAGLLRDMGVQRGQGWHFGRPGDPSSARVPEQATDATVAPVDRTTVR